MKALILAAAIGMVAFSAALVPGSTAQTAQAQSNPPQAVATCVKHVVSAASALRVSPKYLTRERASGTCQRNRARPVLSTAEILRNYVVAAKIDSKTAPPAVVKACPQVVGKAVVASGADPKSASPANMKTACDNAKGRPILASANFLGRITAGVRCTDRTLASLRALNLNAKLTDPKNIQTACKNAANRPVFAVRNYLTTITKGAK